MRARVWGTVCLCLAAALPACDDDGDDGGGRSDAGVAADGPFLIVSPADGARVGGTMFFAVQPAPGAELASVRFFAGERLLGVDEDAAGGFRVFLLPAELPAGPLTLTAEATDVTGAVARRSVAVEVLAEPPSSVRVGDDGAVLGTREENGAVSTLVLPPGVARGAEVTFRARTQQQVLDEVGVDYDALGVTFLGAQAIESSAPLDGPIAVASGGFGPQVQPGQVVVNYLIAPDLNGDGVGELVVANTASVAPNGDVVTDPVPRVMLTAIETLSPAGASGARAPEEGAAGPVGTMLRLRVTGFNPLSPFGNQAEFVSEVDGTREVVTGVVVPEPAAFEPDAAPVTGQVFLTAIPGTLPPGPATLTLRNPGTGETTPPVTVRVEPSPALDRPPMEVVGAFVAAMEMHLEASAPLLSHPNVTPHQREVLAERKAEVLAALADLRAEAEALDDADLVPFATFLANSGFAAADPARLAFISDELKAALASWGFFAGGVSLTNASLAMLEREVATRLLGAAAQRLVFGGLAFVGAGVASFALGFFLAAVTIAALDAITGMGSTMPTGGAVTGGVRRGGAGALRVRPPPLKQGAPPGVLVTIVSGNGPQAFRGLADAGGYFSVPLVPENEPYLAIARDPTTGEVRVLSGVGPPVGRRDYLFFDFVEQPGPELPELRPGERAGRRLSTADPPAVFRFAGRAGQRIALFYAVDPDDAVASALSFRLIAPNGDVLATPPGWPGSFGEPFTDVLPLGELPQDGTYLLLVKNLLAPAEPGEYGVDLALVEMPGAAPVARAGALGERLAVDDVGPREFVALRFEAEAGDRVGGVASWVRDAGGPIAVMHTVLLGPDGAEVERWLSDEGNDRGGRAFLEARPLPATGTYTVVLALHGDAGPRVYDLRVALTTFPPAPPLAAPIGPGETVREAALAPHDHRLYTLTGTPGARLAGRVSWTRPGGGIEDCLRLLLVSPEGERVDDQLLASRCLEDEAQDVPFAFEEPMTSAGRYTLVVTGGADVTYAYELTVEAP